MPKKIGPLPNFLIVGAAKSGTTSLYHYLKQHPDVFMPDWKEPAFFAPRDAGGIQDEEEYRALFYGSEGKTAIGEASVAYLYASEAAKKIRDFLGPNTKIVMLLRNPVDMAYSNWGHQRREGYEALSFEEALQAEKERKKNPDFGNDLKTWIGDLLYCDRAHYPPQITRYDDALGADNVKIYIYEEFFSSGLPFWKDLCVFLGIESTFVPDAEVHNRAGRSRSKALQKILNERKFWKEPLKAVLPPSFRKKLKAKLYNFNRADTPLEQMDKQTRELLEHLFADDVKWLEERIRRPLTELWFPDKTKIQEAGENAATISHEL